jgi:hypothetical protein
VGNLSNKLVLLKPLLQPSALALKSEWLTHVSVHSEEEDSQCGQSRLRKPGPDRSRGGKISTCVGVHHFCLSGGGVYH